jgi:hypothetical protein
MGPMITIVYGVYAVFLIAVSGFVIFAALRMMKLKSWPLALTASILVMIPCFSGYACLLGVPIGIWAIVVLVNAETRAAFQQQASGQN